MPDSELLETIVRNIVEKSDAVEVTRGIDERGVLLTLRVDPVDMGKVIGRGGEVAMAIRMIMRLKGRRENAVVSLKIWEPEGEVVHREHTPA